MTNLTSEQFRDILHNLEGVTLETPNVQGLLRRATEAFYSRFGCYPETAAAAPGCGSLFGEQTQFDEGMAVTIPLPMMTVVVGRKVPGNRVTVVTTADVGHPHKVSFSLSECPLIPSGPVWLDYVKSVMAIYCCRRRITAFQAAIHSNLPLGVGLGSSASLEIALFTFFEVTFGKKVHPIDKAIACQYAEEDFLNRKAGTVTRLCASTAKDRNFVLIDTMTNEINWYPSRNKEVVFVIIDSHLRDTLFGHEYPERSKYLNKACEILNIENLRLATVEDLDTLDERIRSGIEGITSGGNSEVEESERKPVFNEEWTETELEIVKSRARFYLTEMKRIEEAMEAWDGQDVETFGRKMNESHDSLKEDFGFSNPVLEFLVETSTQVDGVLGSRMVGLGLDCGGTVITLVYKNCLQDLCEHVQTSFAEHRNELLAKLEEKWMEKLVDSEKKNENKGEKENEETPCAGNLVNGTENYKGGDAELTSRAEVDGVKKKKKCDPSKKRKNNIDREEWLRLKAERQRALEEEAERLRILEEEEMRRKMEEEEIERQRQLEEGKRKAEKQGEENSLEMPSIYIVSPMAGARIMFPVDTDLLRSRYAQRIPQPKELVRKAIETFHDAFQQEPEAIGLAPATTTLFGEFLEYNMGYVIEMALPLLTVTVGARNDKAVFEMRSTSTEIGTRTEFRAPVPCAGTLAVQNETWINHGVNTVAEFKGHVPGFVSVVESRVPCQIGLHSCSAFQASIYEFLEGLTGTCTDPLEKAYRCNEAEARNLTHPGITQTNCSPLRFIPTFLCKKGYVLLINSKNLRMANYYLDHPSYAFLLAHCKERSSTLTMDDIKTRLRSCCEAAELLGLDTITSANERHVHCLKKRGVAEDMIRRVRYVITEQERCVKTIEAIKNDDYEILGMLMTRSHRSLRDDFEVSTPEVEVVVDLALSVKGVLGAKLVGKGLTSTVLILSELSSVDACIKHVRKNYVPKQDRPSFYVFRPSSGAYAMNPEDVTLIP